MKINYNKMKTTMGIITLLFLMACNVNYEKTPSGLVYKIYEGKGGDTPNAGEFVKFHVKYTVGEKDSVLNSSFGKIPGYGPIDTSERAVYTFMEILPKMQAGDSAEIVLSVDTLKNRKFIPDYDETFVQGGSIHCTVKLLDVFQSDSAMMADYQSESDLEKEREVKSIESYLAEKGLKGQKTKSGAYVTIETAGDPNVKADSGKIAVIMYRGYLQSNGLVFDTNMDTSKGHTDPIEVPVGSRQVIQGWDEALPYFGKGAKGKILVPSMLGYGPQGRGPEMPPYSNLVFDIEVVDVRNAPAESSRPAEME